MLESSSINTLRIDYKKMISTSWRSCSRLRKKSLRTRSGPRKPTLLRRPVALVAQPRQSSRSSLTKKLMSLNSLNTDLKVFGRVMLSLNI